MNKPNQSQRVYEKNLSSYYDTFVKQCVDQRNQFDYGLFWINFVIMFSLLLYMPKYHAHDPAWNLTLAFSIAAIVLLLVVRRVNAYHAQLLIDCMNSPVDQKLKNKVQYIIGMMYGLDFATSFFTTGALLAFISKVTSYYNLAG